MTLTDPPPNGAADDSTNLWSLIADLSHQLNVNHQQVTSLQQQLASLKGKSLHTNTGYALRRFNTDISKEKFESEVEKWNVSLTQENNDLRWENKMNEKLLKEYEQCLEVVMHKFRTFAHSSQSHILKLTRWYEDLLEKNKYDEKERELSRETAISSSLSHLGTLVRNALREVEGEGDQEQVLDTSNNEDNDAYAGISHEDSDMPAAGPSSHTRTATYGSTDPRWYGSGGYTGKHGDPEALRSDMALERAVELERLRFENEELRKVLELSQGKGLDVGFGKEKLSLGVPRGKRTGTESVRTGGPPSVASMSSSSSSTSSSDENAQIQQQQQQQQQRLPSVPSAPLPTASISQPSTTPMPPPSPAPRATFQERMSQAFEAIKPKPAAAAVTTTTAAASNVSVGAPSAGAAATPSAEASSSSSTSPTSSTTPLIPTPRDSAPAQSDIRGAPVLTLSEESGEAEAEAEEVKSAGAQEDQSSSGGDAVQEAVVVDSEEGEEQSAGTGNEEPDADGPQVPVATDTAAAVGVDEAQSTEEVDSSGEQVETAEEAKE